MTHYHRLVLVPLAGVLVGCGAHARPNLAPDPLAPLPVTSVAAVTSGTEVKLVPDQTTALIVKIETEFSAGQRELDAGRLVAARNHFDAAVDLMLAQPEGARATPRLAAAFDQLLDRISALDVLALREGDGFTETRTEPAAIDELLGAAVFERPKPAATTRETVEADLARGSFNIEIPANERVLSYIELFQGRLHDFMEAGLSRSLRYLPMIQEVFQKQGLPSDLAYVPLVESAFKVNALSRVKARGLWQFMPGTGREYDLDQTWFVDERADPEKATVAAAAYLKYLRAYFDGDWNLALASYNAGPGRLQGAIRKARTADFWTLSASTKYLPRETREYVPMIMAATIIAKNPTLYGFDVDGANPLAYDSVVVPNALDLKIIAEWISCSVDDLRELNPELRRTTTPAGDHELKVPLGTAATVRSKLATIDPSLYVRFNFYTVRRGDTVASIARKYRINQSDLRLANDLTARAKVRVNQSLMIPQRSATGLPSSPAARTVNASVAPTRTTPRSTAAGPVTYRVQRGDTLYSIAKQFATTVDALRKINRIAGTQINVGARLTVRQ